MFEECPNCKLKYERAPGYFLGSTYINYAASALLIIVSYMVLHFGVGYSNRTLALPLTTFAVCFPMFFFRYARSLWLGLDCYIDPAPTETDRD